MGKIGHEATKREGGFLRGQLRRESVPFDYPGKGKEHESK